MFRKMTNKKNEDEDNPKFQAPRIGKTTEIRTHLKEKTSIEKIFQGFKIKLKRKTVFRLILNLPQIDLDRNIYMIADNMLQAFLSDNIIDSLFYKAFSRLTKSEKSFCIKDLCFNYLLAQLQMDKKYLNLTHFLIRHFKDVFIERRNEIVKILDDYDLKKVILALKEDEKDRNSAKKLPLIFID